MGTRLIWLNPPSGPAWKSSNSPAPWAGRGIGTSSGSPVSSAALTPGPAPGGRGEIGTVRYPRIVPRDEECARRLKKRTLTNLYNERPTWLALAHRKLDEAVLAAYS
jgi:hypothetical protein